MTGTYQTLSTRLCPWLAPALARLETAHGAGRLGHAWVFAGPHGVGKVNLALVFARRLLENAQAAATEPPPLAAGEFAAAMAQRYEPADHHPDLYYLFPDEAKKGRDDDADEPARRKRSIAIDQVRDVAKDLTLKAHAGGAKVLVIEPADSMNVHAMNALLKTLEEPTPATYLFLLAQQPERLVATIRSRCQKLALPSPSPEALAAWLGLDDPVQMHEILLATGRSPLAAAAALSGSTLQRIKDLNDSLVRVASGRTDPIATADAWLKTDEPDKSEHHAFVLGWLLRRLHGAIRARLAPEASNPVTVGASDPLHTAWNALALSTLFAQYRAAERLLGQLGGGVNVELAMRALLLGFQPDRGRP